MDNNSLKVRKMLTASGGPIYEEDWSDRWEPYAAGIGLAGDAVGLGAAATGVGIPVGTAIAGFANIPNLIIDGYQTARDTWRSFNDNGNSLGSAAWNGGEFILDATGLKALQYINKAQRAGVKAEQVISSMERKATHPYKRVGTGASRSRLRKSAESKRSYNAGRNKALEESTNTLAKKGVRETQGEYFRRKLADEMAKRGYGVSVNDAIKSANRTLRQNLAAINTISGGTNIYHLLPKRKNGGLIRKMQTAAGGPIYWLRKRLYNNIEPFGYNDVGSRLINAVVLNKNEHNNFKGDYSDPKKVPAEYQVTNELWREYLHIPEEEGIYSNGKYKIKNNGNGTFSLPFESMKDIMQAVNSSNNPLLWGLRGKLGNSVVGEYDVHRGYDRNGDYLKYIDHWRINPYDVKEGKEYGLDDNSLLKWYFKGKDDASFGLGTPVEIQGKYYLDDIYNVKGKDRGGHYLPEVVVTGNKKKQGGKMNILEFLKNGGQIRKMQTASGGPIKLYDTLWADNWRDRLTSPVVVAKQLAELTRKIPIKYLGGSKDNARKEFWKQEPVLQHAVDSVANLYGISPESLKYRLDREGFTDRLIQRRNNRIKIGALRFEPRGYELLNNPNYGLDGTQIGLDDAKTYIDSGKVKLINENWDERGPFKNEKGRMTYPVNPVTLNDGTGIVAAHLKYFRDEALLDFPNAPEYDLDRYANAYYNRGALGGKKWVLAGAKGYNYREKGGMLELLKNGSGIHIKKENKGKFTSYCGGKVTSECIAKGKASSNPAIRKRATFAANARKWKHKNGGVIKAQEGTKMNWGELAKIVGGIASNAMSTVSENKKLNAWSKQYKLEKVNPLDYITKYLLEILENNLRSQQAARALGSTVNFNPDIDKHFAYLLANQEVARKNREIDKQNKLLDVLTENLKTSNWMNLFGNIALTGLGYLTSNIGKKSTNVPPSSTSTTANTATTSNFNNYMNNITIQKQLGIV